MTLRILLTGKNGQVGSELARLVPSVAELAAVGRDELDLARPDEIRRVIGEVRPNVIINAAAYTAVDQAEKEEVVARAVNRDAPAVIAEEAKKIGAFLIQYSTDYVFDGAKRSPYTETDATNPLNAYGRTKLAGEEAIRASSAAHLILRTAWVYATAGRNFLLTILRLAAKREELRIVNDQFGAPTSACAIASATTRLVSGAGDALGFLRKNAGTYHLSAAGETTWYEFACAILEAVRRKGSHVPAVGSPTDLAWLDAATAGHPLITKRIVPIATTDYPTPARRPAYSVLSNRRFAATFGFSLPDWRLQLAEIVDGFRSSKGDGRSPLEA
jgi:dTDP-4-dehydrorhamnose reductase